MKHTKREWMPLYSFLDRKRVTDHLADMAARGWMLDRLGTWSWHYRRTEPKQLRFAVTFFAGAGRFSPAPAAGLDTFQDYCAQAGWHRAASSDQVQVFYSEDPAAVPIDTDPAAELENIRRSIGKPMIRNYLALLLLWTGISIAVAGCTLTVRLTRSIYRAILYPKKGEDADE